MTDELTKAVSRIRSVSPKINKAADDATAAVRAVEAFLTDSGVGGTADVCFRRQIESVEDDHDGTRQREVAASLAYGRHEGKCRILIVESYSEDGGDEWVDAHKTPWLESPRDARLESFPSLPKLLTEIADEAERLAGKVESAGEAVAAVLSALGVNAPPDRDPSAPKPGAKPLGTLVTRKR